MARALVFDPALVLMDEPLGALDKQLREQMQYEIKRLHERFGITVVYVTHDQSEALTMSDRIAVFERGAVQQLATPAALYEAPETQLRGALHRREQQPRPAASLPAPAAPAASSSTTARRSRPLPFAVSAPGGARPCRSGPSASSSTPRRTRVPTRLPGRVRELIYVGDHLRAHLAVGAQEFIVKIPNAVTCRSAGDEIAIGWHTEDCRRARPRLMTQG